MRSGQIELMLHRRLFNDDAFGVGEPLNETAFGVGLVVRGRHRVLLCEDTELNCDMEARMEAERMLMKPVIIFGWQECSQSNNLETSFPSLPDGVKMLTLEKWGNDKSVLIRLENMNTVTSTSVSLTKILEQIGEITGVQETTLDGNMNLDDLNRLQWNDNDKRRKSKTRGIDPDNIGLEPKQIRSFVFTFQ